MIKILVTFALGLLSLLALPAHAAALEAHQGADWIRITDAPCTNAGVAARVSSEIYAQMHAANAMIDGHMFQACWLSVREDMGVGVVFEDGDHALVPRAMFRAPKEA